MTTTPLYATREDWLNAVVEETRSVFELLNFPLPEKIKVSCGFPSQRARARRQTVGECWSSAATADGTVQMFVSPVLDDPLQVFAVVVAQLCHAATEGDGYKGRYPAAMKAVCLEGKPTAPSMGFDFRAMWSDLVGQFGAYPHERLQVATKVEPQGTRMLKAVCPACGYTIRLTAKWAKIGLPDCTNIFSHPSKSVELFELA